MNRNEAPPLIGRDLPELERALPAVWPDCTGAYSRVVDEDVDAAKLAVRCSLIAAAAESSVSSVWTVRRSADFPCSREVAARVSRGSRSRSTATTRVPAASRPRTIAFPIPPAAPVTIATLGVLVIARSSHAARAYPNPDSKKGTAAQYKLRRPSSTETCLHVRYSSPHREPNGCSQRLSCDNHVGFGSWDL